VVEISEGMLDEALRMGTQSAAMANRYLMLSRELILAVNKALELMGSGQVQSAREVLLTAQKQTVGRVITETDMVAAIDRIVRDHCPGDKLVRQRLIRELLQAFEVK
jgi:hypothetical protein